MFGRWKNIFLPRTSMKSFLSNENCVQLFMTVSDTGVDGRHFMDLKYSSDNTDQWCRATGTLRRFKSVFLLQPMLDKTAFLNLMSLSESPLRSSAKHWPPRTSDASPSALSFFVKTSWSCRQSAHGHMHRLPNVIGRAAAGQFSFSLTGGDEIEQP